MFSDLDRQMLRGVWTLYTGDMPNIIAVAGLSFPRRVPFNCVLTDLCASALSITSASQFVVALKRGSTTLVSISSAVPYVASVVFSTSGLSIPLFTGDALTLFVNGTDADTDDATGVIIEAGYQLLANAPSI